MISRRLLPGMAILLLALPLAAQQTTNLILPPTPSPEQIIASTKKDVGAAKREIIASAMVPELKPEDVKPFWSVYDRYDKEMSVLFEKSLQLIYRYASIYENPAPDQVQQLMDELFGLDAAKVQVRKRYFGEFSKAISVKVAARFTMVDTRVTRLIEAKMASEIPLVAAR